MSNEVDTGVVEGSTNVFADLGLPDAVERQTKTRLALELNELLKARGLKQVDAARALKIPQPKVSALANYRLDGFSVEKLMELLTHLNQDVEILIRPSRKSAPPGHVSVVRLPITRAKMATPASPAPPDKARDSAQAAARIARRGRGPG